MSGFATEMAGHDEAYAETEAAKGPPIFTDGQHQAVINVARVEEGTYGWQLILGFTGTDASTKNQASVRKWHNLPPEEDRLKFFKGDMETLGYKGSLSELEQACIDEVFIGLLCDIGVKTKTGAERDYTNVYINRCHGRVDASGLPPAGELPEQDFQAADDDIPF